MKTSEFHLRRVVCYAFIMLTITSCQTEKFLNRQKSNRLVAEDQKILINRQQLDLLQGRHMIRLSDSSEHSYKISILPVDTFSFSLKQGFKGKALSIEIQGKQSFLRNMSDSSDQFLQSHNSEKSSMKVRRMQKQSANLKVKEKQSRLVPGNIVLVLFGALILFGLWRYMERAR